MTGFDYRKLYDLERHLFENVHGNFHKNGSIGAFDFFCIVIWKSNRSRTRVAERIRKQEGVNLEGKSLDERVKMLTSSLYEVSDMRSRLRILIERWGFRLPMATAILTVLYPDEFTVYDRRVCGVLKEENVEWERFEKLVNKTNIEKIWQDYQEYIKAVTKTAPRDLCLRDKDRWLWGKSLHADITNLIQSS